MRYLLLLCFLLFAAGSLFAQPGKTGVIKGTVIDSTTRQAVREAAVSLLSASDSSFITYTITGGEGNFQFTKLPFGQYRILVTFIGYKNLSRVVTLTQDIPQVDLAHLPMVQTSIELGEVTIVQERPPITIKSDTVEFNAGSFKTRPNAQVEELLKKLPGIEVSRDGTVTAQGEEVKRILVDGKPFFGDDPKVATRNLPAEIIENIQVFNQQSDQSSFSGFDDGTREKTINLTTKKDKRKGLFGQNSIGIGTQDRYQGKLNLNRFNNNQQISLIGMANNINQQGFTIQDMFNFGTGSVSGQGGGMAGTDNGGALNGPILVTPGGRFGMGGGNNNGNTSNNITESWAGGINFRDSPGKKLDINGSYFINRANVTTRQNSLRQNILPDTTFFTQQQNQSGNLTTSHRLNLRLDYRIDSLNSIRITPSFTFQHAQYNSYSNSMAFTGANIPLNQSQTTHTASGNGVSGTNNLLYMHKFRKKGRTFSLNLNTYLNNQNRNGINQSENLFFDSPDSQPLDRSFNQQTTQQAKALTNTLNLSFTEPLSLRKTLEFHYISGNNANTSHREVADFNEQTGRYDNPNEQLSNRFENGFMTQRAGFTLQTRRLKYTYSAGLDLQKAELDTRNLSHDQTLTKQFINILPSALFTYNFSSNRTLRLTYRSRINAPSVSQLQPVPDNTNPLHIIQGNPQLKPEYVNSLMAMYNSFNASNFRSTIAVLNISHTDNKIVNASQISPSGTQQTSFVNTHGYYQANGFMAVNRRIRPIKSSISFTTNLSYNNGRNFINEQENLSSRVMIGQGVNLTSNISEKLDFTVGGTVTYQQAGYSLLKSQNSSFFNKLVNLDLFYELPLKFTFTTELTYNHNSGRSAGFNQQYVLWNASIGRQFFKNKQGEVKLGVYDLLNQNRSIERNVRDTYVEDIRSQVLQQYFILSFTYNLRKFGGSTVFPAGRPGILPPHLQRN